MSADDALWSVLVLVAVGFCAFVGAYLGVVSAVTRPGRQVEATPIRHTIVERR